MTTALGVLGMPGFTAYAGLTQIGRPKPGETVGGHVWHAVFPRLNTFARIPVCGLVAHYCETELPEGPDRTPLLMSAILRRSLTCAGSSRTSSPAP